MNPDKTLAEIRDLLAYIGDLETRSQELDTGKESADLFEAADDQRVALADKFVALDKWLSDGGRLPAVWARPGGGEFRRGTHAWPGDQHPSQ
ncbi:hypothetical protein [Amycolatopsis sp. La24]|uniref:hypothetical protein n=1 Tax=Amycolatopsis sp. La24 TaxID=3028304 RepID=UPI0023B03531|nr:hypothetical protein [Amycolatopsis sp. La24]